MTGGVALLALALAGQAGVAADDDVVVTARRAMPPAAVRHLTQAITPVIDDQFARFADRICVSVTGLEAAHARIVADRVRAVARISRVPVGPDGCPANVVIALVADGRAMLAEMVRRRHPFVAGLDTNTRRRLLADHGPVHQFSATELRSRDGDRVHGGTLYVQTSSYLQLPTRLDVTATVLLIDAPASLGRTLRQIADYAAMRTLGQARVDHVPADADTILTLFDPLAVPPPTLSAFDAAYLRQLYFGPATHPGRSKAAAIAAAINRDAGVGRGSPASSPAPAP